MSWTVYMHKFPNNKVYIGITKNTPQRRWRNNGSGYKTQKLMWRAIQKYGWNNVEHIILFKDIDEKQAKKKEQELIAKYRSNVFDYGYNLTQGGDGVHGYICSEETRQKLSKIWKGRHHTEETKRLMSERAKGHKVSERVLETLAITRKRLAESGALKHPHNMTKQGRLVQQKNTSSALVQYNNKKEPIALWESGALVKQLKNINPYNATRNFNLKAGGYYWKKCEDILPEERIKIVFQNLKVYLYEEMEGGII